MLILPGRGGGAAYRQGVIDTHCHLTFPDFADRIEETIQEAKDVGVDGLITICTTTQNADECVHVADLFENVWCSAGVHPLYADQGPHDWSALARAARHPKCVAWGELGLDNHYDNPPGDIQRSVLDEQLGFIESQRDSGVEMAIVLHCRKAFDDLIPILRASTLDPSRFVFHCFTGDESDAKKCLDFGAMISFTGVVTYPSAKEVQAAALLVPGDRIMVETDAPFLSPVPHRGKRPCRPAWVRDTAEHLAKIRGVAFEEFHAQINANSERFFGIKPAT